MGESDSGCAFRKQAVSSAGLHYMALFHIIWHLQQSVSTLNCTYELQGCQPVRNFRILYGFYMQNTGVRIWPRKYGN